VVEVLAQRSIIIVLLASTVFAQGTVTHFIYLQKENRSFDGYFGNGLAGVQSYCQGGHSPAQTVCYAPIDATSQCTKGDTCPYPAGTSPATCGNAASGGIATFSGQSQQLLLECASTVYHDITHTHLALAEDIDNGAMDKFETDGCGSNSSAQSLACGYAYFDQTQIGTLYSWATSYAIADNFFSSLMPSQPAHMMMFAATTGGIVDNGGVGLKSGGKTCQTGQYAGNTCSCSGTTCDDPADCGSSTPSCSDAWANNWT